MKRIYQKKPRKIQMIEGRSYAKCENNIYYSSLGANDADTITYSQIDYSFSMLLKLIFHIINCGRTVSYNPNIYICDNSNYTSTNYQF